MGVATCGCFGSIQASPWHAFAVDASALLLLALFRPVRSPIHDLLQESTRPIVMTGTTYVLGVVVPLTVVTGIATRVYGSPEVALARLRGELITVSTPYADFGRGQPGEVRDAVVEVRNWTDVPVRLIGGTSDCSCVTTANLPIVLPPATRVPLTVRLKFPDTHAGGMTRAAVLWTDCDRQKKVQFLVGCEVRN